jgi:hypothetical protein
MTYYLERDALNHDEPTDETSARRAATPAYDAADAE